MKKMICSTHSFHHIEFFVYPVGLEIESIYHRTDSIIVDYNYKTNTDVFMIYPMYKRLIIGHGRFNECRRTAHFE